MEYTFREHRRSQCILTHELDGNEYRGGVSLDPQVQLGGLRCRQVEGQSQGRSWIGPCVARDPVARLDDLARPAGSQDVKTQVIQRRVRDVQNECGRSIRPVLHRHAKPESRRGELIVGCAADHIPKVIAALEYFGQRGARGRILQYLQLARRNSIRKIARRRECSLGARAPERNCEQKAPQDGCVRRRHTRKFDMAGRMWHLPRLPRLGIPPHSLSPSAPGASPPSDISACGVRFIRIKQEVNVRGCTEKTISQGKCVPVGDG